MSIGDTFWASLPTPVLLVSAEDRILNANPAAEVFLNSSGKALAGALVWEKVNVDFALKEALARSRRDNSVLYVNDVAVDGERAGITCNVQIAPLAESDGQLIFMITPRELVTRLNTLNSTGAAIGMADMLAHEIKNPLAGITGAAQLLSMNLGREDREMTDLIVAESKRIVKLLEQVEQFGNMRPPEKKPVNIHDVLERAQKSAALGFGASVIFIKEYDPSLPNAHGDADQLLQVFLNLLKNASEALGNFGGIVKVKTSYDLSLRLRRNKGEMVYAPLQVEVIDDGPGLPETIEHSLFEPFVSGRENGTGLGLALVSKILTEHDGWITADSVPGRTTFKVSLPIARDQNNRSEMEIG